MKLVQTMNLSHLDEATDLSLNWSRMKVQIGETSKLARLERGRQLELARLARKSLVT